MFTQNQNKGGLFGGNQGGGGGSTLFGGNQQNQQQGGGNLFNQQNKPTGGSLFGNTNQTQGGGGGNLFSGNQQGQGQQQGGGGLFGGNQQQGQQSSGGLFGNNQQNKSGGLFGGGGSSSSGSLFGGNTSNTQSSSSLFGGGNKIGTNTNSSLFGNQGQGQSQSGSLFGGQQQQQQQQQQQLQQQIVLPDARRYFLHSSNPLNLKKVNDIQIPGGSLADVVNMIAKKKDENKNDRDTCVKKNEEILSLREELIREKYKVTQRLKEFITTLSQASLLTDKFKSEHFAFEDIINQFEGTLNRMNGGDLPRIELPSDFIIDLTSYFAVILGDLRNKVCEIEEMIKQSSISKDSEDYEKLILVLEELYNYYMTVSNKVFSFNERMNNMRQRFKEHIQMKGGNFNAMMQITTTKPEEYIGKLDNLSKVLAKKEEDLIIERKTLANKQQNTKK